MTDADRPLRVLVTNDDGVASPGIVALAAALHDAGHDVRVVAPASDLSGAGASIGPLHRGEPIPVAERTLARAARTSRCSPSSDRRRPRSTSRASARSASAPTSWRRASTPAPTPATSSCTAGRSAPRSPRPGSASPRSR